MWPPPMMCCRRQGNTMPWQVMNDYHARTPQMLDQGKSARLHPDLDPRRNGSTKPQSGPRKLANCVMVDCQMEPLYK